MQAIGSMQSLMNEITGSFQREARPGTLNGVFAALRQAEAQAPHDGTLNGVAAAIKTAMQRAPRPGTLDSYVAEAGGSQGHRLDIAA